jgi:MFS family permease
MTVVGNWFRKNVSIATGVAVCGSAFGGLLVPVVTQMIGIYGWRMAMVILGFGAWIILLPLSMVIRHKPEQYGYIPDGEISSIHEERQKNPSRMDGISVDTGVKQALVSRPFWHIAAGLFFFLFVAIAVITHVVPYLSSIEIPRSVSSLAATGIALASIAGRIGFGWFADRYDKRKVMSFGFLITVISLLCLGSIPFTGVWLIVLFALLFGIGYGGAFPMLSVLLLEYFGRARLGSILGINMGITMIGGIMGPPLVGWVFDTYGSYQSVWYAFSGIVLIGMIILITTPSLKSWHKPGKYIE